MDKLTFFLTLFTSLAALADFLIGKNGRKRIQEKVFSWWIVISELPYFGVAKREVEWFSRTFHTIFGIPFKSLRFYVLTTLLSILVTTITFGTTIYWAFSFGSWTSEPKLSVLKDLILAWLGTFLAAVRLEDLQTGMYIGNVVGDLTSMAITLILLRKMTSALEPKQLVTYFVIDFSIAAFFIFFVLGMTAAFDAFTAGNPFFLSMIGGLLEGPFYLIEAFGGDREAIAISAPAIVALAPTLTHILIILAVFFTKLATPVLRPIVLLLLERFYEAEKGVVTLAVGGTAGIIKLIQIAITAF